jgi:UDP-glucose 6-dehydrogenase
VAKVSVLGLGYVGAVSVAGAAASGHSADGVTDRYRGICW